MKNFRTLVLLLAAFFALAAIGLAQDTSTQGTEFWVSFMTNGHRYHPSAPNEGNWILTQVLLSAKRNCSGTITNPQTGWTTDFNVQANNITTVDIPDFVAYVDGISEQVQNKGILINSTDTISVFCTNIAYLSFDASCVLPLQSLADDYIIQTYNQSHASSQQSYLRTNQTSAFLIVAAEDNTTIDITPTVTTMGNHHAGQTFSVNLDQGQVYQVRSTNEGDNRDLSGSRVTARDEKPIAVFNGNTLTAIPNNANSNGSSFDHIFEQALPLQAWGKKFVVTNSLEREKDYVKITSASDHNNILKNGQHLTTLQTNDSYLFELTNDDRSCFIETSGRAAVYLYNTERGGNSIGDPSVVWIAPIEQRIDEITFSTFNNENINIATHHVNIIVSRNDIENVYLDGNLLPANSFENVVGSSDYAFTRQNIQHGVHHVQCSQGLNAHVYGFGVAKGYAYMVGSKTIDLSTKVTINETPVPKQGTYEYCPDEAITFEAEVNANDYDILWEFGDGATSTQNPTTHTYNEKRVYEVTLTVQADSKGQRANDVSKYYVDTRTHTITELAEVCSGDFYIGHGLNVAIMGDTILGTQIDNNVHPVCKDSLLIYVTALPGFYANYNDTRCWFGEPETYNSHGFSFVYDHPGEYDQQITKPNPEGCDSIIDLHLTVAERIINPDTLVHTECAASFTWNGIDYTEDGIYDQVYTSAAGCDSIVSLKLSLSATIEGGTDTINGGCNSYLWNGQYYHEAGFYTDTIPSALGCDSIVHLQLNLASAPDPSEIFCADTSNHAPHWVITATEFEIHSYDFTLWDNEEGNVWDSVVWSFESDINWRLEPYGDKNKFCKVFVTDHLDDTVWLNAKVYNPCDPGNGIERRFWLISSFFGMDENEMKTQIDIVPNPSNGEITLIFGHMTGQVTTKVYSMTGKLIDQFDLNVTPNSIHPYNLNGYPSGIYLFVFNNEGKKLTQKVIVTK